MSAGRTSVCWVTLVGVGGQRPCHLLQRERWTRQEVRSHLSIPFLSLSLYSSSLRHQHATPLSIHTSCPFAPLLMATPPPVPSHQLPCLALTCTPFHTRSLQSSYTPFTILSPFPTESLQVKPLHALYSVPTVSIPSTPRSLSPSLPSSPPIPHIHLDPYFHPFPMLSLVQALTFTPSYLHPSSPLPI